MTVEYSAEVSTISSTTLFKLFLKWRGSMYKAVYPEFLVYAAAYFFISIIYRLALDSHQRQQVDLWTGTYWGRGSSCSSLAGHLAYRLRWPANRIHFVKTVVEWRNFEDLSLFMDSFTSYIPMAFILGFYVSIVFTRWSTIYKLLPYPDNAVLTICTHMNGTDPRSKAYRETIVRYLLSALVLSWRDISAAVRKRFPTLQHVVDAGILRSDELELYEAATEVNSHKFYIPIQWVLNILTKCREESRIKADVFLNESCRQVLEYRSGLGSLLGSDWVSVPLIYTQIVATATWFYFFVCLFGRQYLDPSKNIPGHKLDLYFPPFTFMQFVIYIGWLKAAEGMINPLGENDDDFELNYLIERNFKVGISQANEHCGKFPTIPDEPELESPKDAEIPHTEASVGQNDNAPLLSATAITVPPELFRTVSTAPDVSNPTPEPSGSLRRRILRGSVAGSRQLSKISHTLKSQFSKTSGDNGVLNNGLAHTNPALTNSDNSLHSLTPSILDLFGIPPAAGAAHSIHSAQIHDDPEQQTPGIQLTSTTEILPRQIARQRSSSMNSSGSESEATSNRIQTRIEVPETEPQRLSTLRETSRENDDGNT